MMDENDNSRSIVRRAPMPGGVSTPLAPPLMTSVAYGAADPDALDAVYEGRAPGYTYAREGHPNATMLAARIDWLEGAEGGIVTSSGMSAVTAAVMALICEGDHVLGSSQLYGRSLRLLTRDLPRLGFATSLVDMTDLAAVEAALRPETRLMLVETISNPTLRVADIAGLAALAQSRDILLAVDNTFATPRAFRPLDAGADVVIHSVTKLLAGHSDVTLGYVAARAEEHRASLRDASETWGLTPSPFDCWLADRGLHTFGVRYDQARANAAELADHLSWCPGVKRVIYPGRADHPDAARAAAMFGANQGCMVCFEIAGGRASANALVRAAAHIPFAPTLGDVATTLAHPASSSHRGLNEKDLASLGISEGFFRVSVGIEDIEMIKMELEAAIEAAAAAPESQADGRAAG